ncbi:Acyltransferase [Rubrivivax sp. A210]|uniref:LpxL/LpxP family acyltransferase n=1 Tax=Rubrivivax sp. A210 TaxID=2772301 RepID=UPI0019193E72|nr:acyl-CoA synthetase [Rubrivivax sp. A210]CAD5372047.1 Acyltransferase [Rubrivivax sp. A210]
MAPPGPRQAAAPEWAASDERSNAVTLRLMAWIAVTAGRPVARLLLHPIALYFLCFAPAPRRHARRYLGRALGRPASWLDLYRHFHAFSATVLDRVYFVRGQMQAFDLQITGEHLVDETLAEGRGAFLLGAHLGSFEALHAVGDSRPGLEVAMVMFPDNARKIHGVLQALAPEFRLSVIAIGRSGSTLQIRDALDAGKLVGLLGDRSLGADSARTLSVELPFLGRAARFTDGPLRLAMLLRRRVIFMVGLYRGGRRYDIRFEVLADFRQPPAEPAAREQAIQTALAAYAARLEALCREVPYNWFNFFDFWNEDAQP